MATIRRHESLKHIFTAEERATLSADLARENLALAQEEEEKKAVMADFKAKIEGIKTNISKLSTFINNGFEYRRVECEIRMDTPEPGKKTIIRLDTGEQVSVQNMTEEEKQGELFDQSLPPTEE